MTIDATPTPRNGVSPEQRLLLDEVEIAEMLGTSRPTIRGWVRLGLLRPVALPGGMRRKLYRRADVEAFVARLSTDATPAR